MSNVTKSTRQRLDWVDIVKATSVVLVVLLHVTQTLSFAVEGTAAASFWVGINTFLEPLRIPVFFTVSGLLASSAVGRDWSFSKARTIGMLYLFLLWHTLFTFFAVGLGLLRNGEIKGGAAGAAATWAWQVLLTPGGFWYFYALALYFVIARLVRNVNPWVVMALAGGVNLARPLTTGFINDTLAPIGVSNMFPSVVLNAVYFLGGVYLVALLKDYAARNDTRMLMGTATIAVVGSTARMFSSELSALSFLPIALAWILTAILVAVRLSRFERVRAFGSYVGARTLPIFVLQFFVLHVLYNVLPSVDGPLEASPVLQLLYPVAITLGISILSLKVYDLAMRRPTTRLLFQAPPAWTARPAQPRRIESSTGALPVMATA